MQLNSWCIESAGFLQSSHVVPGPNTQHTSIHYSWSFGLLTSNTEMAQRRRNSIIWTIHLWNRPETDHRLSLRLKSTHPKCIDNLEKSCTLKTTFPLNKIPKKDRWISKRFLRMPQKAKRRNACVSVEPTVRWIHRASYSLVDRLWATELVCPLFYAGYRGRGGHLGVKGISIWLKMTDIEQYEPDYLLTVGQCSLALKLLYTSLS